MRVLPLVLAAAAAPCIYSADVSFARDVAPIFATRCYGCHAGSVKMGGLALDDFSALMTGGNHGAVIAAGKPLESRLYLMITGKTKPAMPMDGTKLGDNDVAAIRGWIEAGAHAPAPGEELPKAAVAVPHVAPRGPVPLQIYDLAWSPDGKIIAIAGFRTVRLVDAATKQQIANLDGEADAVRAVAFSNDGKRVAAAGGLPGRSGEVRIFDVAEKKLLTTIKGHGDCLYAVEFSPDGSQLATAGYDKVIKLWDPSTGKEIRTLKDHIDAIYALAFTPDGKRIISGAADRTIKIWDISTGERLYTLSEPQDGINAVAVDPAGKYVAAGGLDKTIRIWKLGDKSATLETSQMAHEDAILKLSWSPNGKTLVSSSADRTVKFFSVPDLHEVQSLPQGDWVYGLQFSPDGHAVAIGQFDGKWDETPAATPNTQRAAR